MTKRVIISICIGIILLNLAFGEIFLFAKDTETIEHFALPEEEIENPIRSSSILAALVAPEPEQTPMILLQKNSIIGNAPTSAIPGREIILYEVQIHDTISTIAARFGISTSTVLWANGLSSKDYILPGQQLKILPVTGVLHKVKSGDNLSSIAVKYSANLEKIKSFNNLTSNDLQPGQELIIPDGKIKAVAPTKYVSNKLPSLKSYFGYPTTGRITQGLHGNNAIDVANACGTGIYAAARGTITTAKISGWNGGAGLYIKIAHSNGTATLYAHLDKVLVKQGEKVNKGQKIGTMGHTGNTRPKGPAGCHLHFGVYGAKNPMAK